MSPRKKLDELPKFTIEDKSKLDNYSSIITFVKSILVIAIAAGLIAIGKNYLKTDSLDDRETKLESRCTSIEKSHAEDHDILIKIKADLDNLIKENR